MKRIIRIFILLSLCAGSAYAQQKAQKVTGTVLDETGSPLPGVAVIENGTSNGVVTGADGTYSISVAGKSVLVFDCMGYTKLEETVQGRTKIDVSLQPETTFLDEAVVVGYGTMKRSDLTGSVSSVSAASLEKFKTNSVASALGGQIAGVNVTSADGTPGSGFSIIVRGVGTVNGDASPLYIVDGFEVDNIDYLAPQDIFSVEVLKDASASAIYGARAANGVVLVTTKSAREGRTVVSYNGSACYRVLSKRLDVMSPYEFVKLQHELNSDHDSNYFRAGVDSEGNPWRFQTMEDYIGYEGINWQDQTFRDTWSQTHDVSISTGNKVAKMTASFSHYDENGIFVNSGFYKNSARIKSSFKLDNNLTFEFNVSYTGQEKYGMGTSGYVLKNIISYRPTAGVLHSDEELVGSAYDPDDENSYNDHFNPLAAAYTTDQSTTTNTWMANGSLTWSISKELKFKTSGSFYQSNIRSDVFYMSESQQAVRSGGAYGQSQMRQNMNYSVNNVLTYDKKIGQNHKITAMLGQEYSQRGSEYMTGQAKEFEIDDLGVDMLSIGSPSLVESSRSLNKRLSFFTRGFYRYRDRYLLTATLRADGSSVFAKGNRWGIFPSFAAAWTVSKEPFMRWSKPWLENLKIRAGWGTVGNDRISNYLTSDIYTPVKYGIGTASVSSLIPKQLSNPDLRWEGATTINAGIDASFLHSRFNLTVDVFQKDTKDLLMQQNLAYVTGWGAQWQNIGKIRNRGLEISLNTINISRKHFSWTTDINVSFIKNKLLSLLDGTDYMLFRSGFNSNNTNYDYIAKVGDALGNMYGYVFDGVYQYSDFEIAPDMTMRLKPGVADMTAHAGTTLTPGHVKYKDLDGNGVINTADRQVIGNGYPKSFGGITNNFTFWNFDLSVMFQYSYGNDVFNVTRYTGTQSNNPSRNSLGEVADHWTPYHASNKVHSIKGYVMHDIYSRFIEDGSYLRLKNLSLGYSVPSKIISRVHISKLRFYASATNLFCLSSYSGYDPEVNSSSSPMMPGLDNSAYPKSTTFIFGAEIKF